MSKTTKTVELTPIGQFFLACFELAHKQGWLEAEIENTLRQLRGEHNEQDVRDLFQSQQRNAGAEHEPAAAEASDILTENTD